MPIAPWTDVVFRVDNGAVTTLRDEPSAPVDAGASSEPGIGVVEAIHVAATAGAPMRSVTTVRATAGVGLEGDRYALGTGTWSPNTTVDRAVTLVEAEEIERLATEHGIVLGAGDTRRNVTTRGIRLNALVGRRFRIGDVQCEGTRLCEPCQYLTDLLGQPVLVPLVHRAGLRARIVTDGEIAVGSEVIALD